jgi:nucleoid-associated protein YgaU
MALTKAMIKAMDPPGGEVTFQYNPTKYQIAKNVEWKNVQQKGADAPPVEFVQGQGRVITMELMVDDLEEGKNVAERVEKLEAFTRVHQGNAKDAKKARPPRVQFFWSDTPKPFPAVIKTLNVTYTLFHPDGRPARATINLTLQEIKDVKGKQNPTSGGQEGLRSHRVTPGETLDMIAYSELGAATHWRYIAELNNIDDPLGIQPGQHLVIAPLR